jgi:large subunit ribosomal protein L17
MLRNLASALLLTERDAEGEENPPKVKGRIVTTVAKAKEVRPLVEKCITIARRALPHQDAADRLEPKADRNTDRWRAWRESEDWYEWNRTVAPAVAARRRVLTLLGDKQAVAVLFDEIAPRMAERPGGYTRILRLAAPRLGDAGPRAILELVGTHDRQRRPSARPTVEAEPEVAEVKAPAPAAQPEPPEPEPTEPESTEPSAEQSALGAEGEARSP